MAHTGRALWGAAVTLAGWAGMAAAQNPAPGSAPAFPSWKRRAAWWSTCTAMP